MTCTSRFFQSKSLLRELFPALHGAHSGRDSLSPRPSADAPPESELDDSPGIAELDGGPGIAEPDDGPEIAELDDGPEIAELDDGPEIAEHIVEDADPSGSPNALPSPTVV